MDDTQFRQLLDFLGLSWQGYRKVRKGVKKRVTRHMQELGCRNLSAYLEQLDRSEAVRRECEQRLSVSISRFFRDQRLWEVLETKILPALIQTCGENLRVWSAGCACGEEAYSLRILWEHMRRSRVNLPQLEIMATDLHPLYLNRARAARYPSSSLREIPKEQRAICFEKETGRNRFRLKPGLKDGIRWLAHDFFSGPHGSGFHLILIRNNLLTYYQDGRVAPVLHEIINVLWVGGYMVIGSHERLPFHVPVLEPSPSLSYAFKKRP
ncbi:MAG: hypothetical protein JRL30_08185 [Deltaproteobacteria bacterium]|nr:hypothetical protein [Deltaproteobacteria bacterium]